VSATVDSHSCYGDDRCYCLIERPDVGKGKVEGKEVMTYVKGEERGGKQRRLSDTVRRISSICLALAPNTRVRRERREGRGR